MGYGKHLKIPVMVVGVNDVGLLIKPDLVTLHKLLRCQLRIEEILRGRNLVMNRPVFVHLGNKGFSNTDFENELYSSRLRIEKLDSETGENILHDGALFKIYAAKRDVSGDGADGVTGSGDIRLNLLVLITLLIILHLIAVHRKGNRLGLHIPGRRFHLHQHIDPSPKRLISLQIQGRKEAGQPDLPGGGNGGAVKGQGGCGASAVSPYGHSRPARSLPRPEP